MSLLRCSIRGLGLRKLLKNGNTSANDGGRRLKRTITALPPQNPLSNVEKLFYSAVLAFSAISVPAYIVYHMNDYTKQEIKEPCKPHNS